MASCPIEWEPLLPGFGARIHGFSPLVPIDPEIAAELHALWLDRGVLVFQGASTTGEQQVAISRIFGELEVHPAREGWVEGHPELTVIQYHPGDAGNSLIYQVEGVPLANWLPWHIDLIYMSGLTRAGSLRAIVLPPDGADTGFIDRAGLYDSLPEALRRKIEGRRVIYRLEPRADCHRYYSCTGVVRTHTPDRIARLAARVEADFPEVSHPMAFAHPDTGRMVLNISPLFLLRVEDMRDEESDALLRALVTHVVETGDRYYHRWEPGDLVLWDNWRMLHSAEGTPIDQARQLYRTTVTGDYGLGRLAHPTPLAA